VRHGLADSGLRLFNNLFTIALHTDTSSNGESFAGLASGPDSHLHLLNARRNIVNLIPDSKVLSSMSAPRVVRNFHIQSKTGLFGKSSRKASFECPHCKARLVSGEDEIGKSDVCPSCGGEFVLAKEAAEKIRRLNEEDKAEAERQASAEEQQQEEAAATKRREKAAAAARRSEKKEEKTDARLQQDAALQLVDAKASFRNYDIRQYPTLRLLATTFVVLMWCIIGFIGLEMLTVLNGIYRIFFDFEPNFGGRDVLGNQVTMSWLEKILYVRAYLLAPLLLLIAAAFLLKLVSELIRLFINVAQDNERLVRLSEAAIGKPWAPK